MERPDMVFCPKMWFVLSRYDIVNDHELRIAGAKHPNGFLDQFQSQRVVLDEIQYVPEILQHIKIRIDRNRNPGIWVMTGSQQFHLMKNISETLAGRIAILELLPFSLAEIGDKRQPLDQILWTGLFPEPA
jgi:predicted AAA+ superfamily ATPase